MDEHLSEGQGNLALRAAKLLQSFAASTLLGKNTRGTCFWGHLLRPEESLLTAFGLITLMTETYASAGKQQLAAFTVNNCDAQWWQRTVA